MVTSIDIVVGGNREDGWMYNEGGEAFYFSSCKKCNHSCICNRPRLMLWFPLLL